MSDVENPTSEEVELLKNLALQMTKPYIELLSAIQEQFRKRHVLLMGGTHLGWEVLSTPLTNRKGQSFAKLDDALAYAFELYEANCE